MVLVVKPAYRYENAIARNRLIPKKKSVSLPKIAIQDNQFPPRPKPQALTVRAQAILDYIEAKPGFTALEYSDLVTESTSMIAAVLLQTDLGQWLASCGKIALPSNAARPRWFTKLPEAYKVNVPTKMPVAQLALPSFGKRAKGSVLDNWGALGDDIVKMLCRNTSSPNIRLQRLATMAAHLSQGVKRELEAQKKIGQLMLAAPVPVIEQAALPKMPKKMPKKALKKAA